MSVIIRSDLSISLKAIVLAICFWQVVINLEQDPNDWLASAELIPSSQLYYSPLRHGNGLEMDNTASEITNKLRRRVSGFVPMRGKKDQLVVESANPGNFIEHAPREMDQDATISRLAALENAMSTGQGDSMGGPNELVGSNGNWQPVVAVPRQFFYQMTNHRQEAQPESVWRGGASPGLSEWGQQATNSMLMEAKLRRAFHPMRGKRVPQQMTSFED